MKTNIGLDEEVKLDIKDALNVLLADKHVLYIKTRNYHWNVTGDSFLELHEFFEKLYKNGEQHIDEIAERIRKLGYEVKGSMQDFLKQSQLNETKQPFNEPKKMISHLLEDHETIIRWIRNHVSVAADSEDYGTEDFLVGLLRDHEKPRGFCVRTSVDFYKKSEQLSRSCLLFTNTFYTINATTMSDNRGELPKNYDLDGEAKIENKRKTRMIIFSTIIIGVVLILISLLSGFLTFPNGGLGTP